MNRILLLLLCFCFTVTSSAQSQPRQGMDAFEIALPSVTGDTVRLSSLKGKVVLLDFWASWCAPCRLSNRSLTRLYSKFRDKGFEIFAVSMDKDKEDWMKAIKKDKINWMQSISTGGWEAPTALQWNVVALPTSYLIGRDGKLLAMDLEGKDLEKALKDLMDK